MARFDKSNPINSTFRAHVAANYPDADLGKIFGCGLDAAGKVVKGAGIDGVVGVLIVTEKPGVVGPLRDVSRVDVMTSGEVTDFGPTAGTPGTDFGEAGKAYYSDAAGNITATWAEGSVYVGHCVEPDRLIVRVNPIPAAAGL
ncbi:hypothetical protein SEA_LEOPARD_26 [Mycobacterium phage Leopard]|uniref:Uncharacterized protein n=1 Tax=Mycobacterium phage Onyinye TaxID=2686235 RepID=A0A6B9L9G8_9CAUD|nr:minor capsid protein [Mycobacterium phage Onyinye]QHB37433.1 minor capsid protein [Mycobacterium phage Onyinye]UOW92904.1 hypothetical protein SEA_LEOPARD_26 [Mycobacterium phage Leopard]WKW85188.1 minor capsid protein [Mycobacterium phage Aikoy]